MVDWSLAQTPNFAAAALGGYQAGQALRAQKAQIALAQRRADMEERDMKREELKLKARASVFTPPTVAQPDGQQPTGTVDAGNSAAPPPPAQPRADGLQINWQALNEYAQLDPEGAQKIAQFAATADKAKLEQAQKHGELKARAAYFLRSKPASERAAAFALLAPELQAAGFSAEDLAQARLDDASLDKDIAFGMTITDAVSMDRNEKKDALAEARARAAEGRAQAADARAAVRFKERDKDRAALAASGRGMVPTTVDDLNY